jgi:hypothetical protein
MASSWDDLRATLGSLADAFGNQAVKELEAEGEVGANAARELAGAIAGEPRGAGRRAAEAAWARLQDGVGWTTPAWRECYVIGQLREATEAGEDAESAEDAAADDEKGTEGEGREGTRGALLKRAMLAVDMAHIMGGPGEIVQRFGRAIETLVRRDREGDAKDAAKDEVLIPDVVPSRAAVRIDPAHALERAEGITAKEFKRNYFNPDKPVCLGNIGGAWPAVGKWRDLRWMARAHGHRNVPLEVGAYDDAANWKEEVMLLSSFIDEYLMPGLAKELSGVDEGKSRRIAYLAQHQLFEQIPELLGDFDNPAVCDVAGGVQRVNAWIGTAGTVTPCHFDSYDNLLGQVAGYKFVRLYSEDDSPFLYRHQGAWAENRSWPAEAGDDSNPGGSTNRHTGDGARVSMGKPRRDAQGNISRVDVEHPDLAKFPLFSKAKHMDVVLGPGEFVYIPARCWHYVRALTTSVSLNFLF